jgi:predicted ATPase/class 3 adenylate cyclase
VAELPSGTVTFLFTDLEVSTRLWDEEPDAMQEALARHDAILRDVIAGHGGHVVKGRGDGVHAAFSTADATVSAAIDAQRALAKETWPVSEPLRVRIGIHTGVAELRDGDYFGSSVNRAARLMDVAHGGQIVASQATADLARDALREVELVDLGEHRLRDLSRAERVFQVNASGLEASFAPLSTVDSFPCNLPLQVSSFIGRDAELELVLQVLEEARVVTLTGVGGVGKTRLAQRAAAEAVPRFREGAWLVELAPVRDPDAVAGAVATVFSVTPRAGQTVEDALAEFLKTKRLLLLLDNCEHVIDATADLVEALEQSCSGLVVLATSREGLAVAGERVVPVPALSRPAADAGIDDVLRADSVRLFVERARGVDPAFAVTDQNAVAVAQICQRLDGVPLAIELAAARVVAMNPGELARGLDRRFETLAGGRRRAVKRHQTLRAAIDWSYDLLSESEQRLLARLSVFAGGCTREAAESVCAGDHIPEGRVFELLANLVARSLVVADRDHPETRYRMSETIREYGEERLAEFGESSGLQTRHVEYYTSFLRTVSDAIRRGDQVGEGRRLIAERDNIMVVFNHAIDTGDAELALRMLETLPTPMLQLGYTLDPPVDAVLGLDGVEDHPLFATALAWAANYRATRGDSQRALLLCEQAVAARATAEPAPIWEVDGLVFNARGVIAFSSGAVLESGRYFVQEVELVRGAGDETVLAITLGGAAMMFAQGGDNQTARRIASEGLAISRRLGLPTPIAMNLLSLAGAIADDDPDEARSLLDESMHLRADLDYEQYGEMTQALIISARLGDWRRTLELAARAIPLLHWLNQAPLLATVFNVVARVLVDDDPELAAVLQGVARQLILSGLAHSGDVDAPAARPEPQPAGPPPFVTVLRRETTGLLVDAIGEQRLRELRAEGEALSVDEAVARARAAIARAQVALTEG